MNTSVTDTIKLFTFWLVVILLLWLATLFVVLQSAGQEATNRIVQPKPIGPVLLVPGQSEVIYGSSAIHLPPPPPKPSFTLAWTQSPGATNYNLLVGHASGDFYTNGLVGTNGAVTVTNLNPRLPYVFAVCALGTNGLVTPLCPEYRWNVNSNSPVVWCDANSECAFVVQSNQTVTCWAASAPAMLGTSLAKNVWSVTNATSNFVKRVVQPPAAVGFFQVK